MASETIPSNSANNWRLTKQREDTGPIPVIRNSDSQEREIVFRTVQSGPAAIGESERDVRNISFMLTTQQIRDRTKTVTRRCGWVFLKPGDRLNACVKCQGLKKGEKMEKLAVIEVVNNWPERLDQIAGLEMRREGFPEMTAAEFVQMFCKNMKVDHFRVVNRIEFKYID